jgi:hypothetical protein
MAGARIEDVASGRAAMNSAPLDPRIERGPCDSVVNDL